jgi:hypothetical protein
MKYQFNINTEKRRPPPLLYWKDLDACHSIDEIDVEKNVCESLLGTLLNTNEKTRDYGHA